MARKIQYGRGLTDLLVTGMELSMLIAKLREFQTPIEQALMMHNLHESFPLNEKKIQSKFLSDNHKRLKSHVSPEVNRLNQKISKINRALAGLDFNQKIPKLKTSDILKVTDRRMKTVLEADNAQSMGNDLFRKELADVLYKPTESILEFIKQAAKESFEDKIELIEQPYKEGLRQALHVCSIGYYTTAVFIAGRTVEELVNDYFQILFLSGKLKRIDLGSLSFENKIGKLYKEKKLEEQVYHSLSNIRIDRNEFGHPSSKQLNKEQAHLKIQVIISEVPKIERKILKLKNIKNS